MHNRILQFGIAQGVDIVEGKSEFEGDLPLLEIVHIKYSSDERG